VLVLEYIFINWLTKTTRMKKIFLLAFIAISAGLSTKAQDSLSNSGYDASYSIKVNPASFFLGKLGLQGEYNFKNKKSVTIGIGIPMEKTGSFELDDTTREISTKTTSLMAGYRMYFGKKRLSGFYFEPYLKYLKNQTNTTINIDVNGSNEQFTLASDYSGIGLGAQLGVQFSIAKVVVFDLFLLGPEINSAKHELLAVNINPNVIPWTQLEEDDIEHDLQDAVKDIPIIGKKIKFEADKNAHSVRSEFKGMLPGFRIGASVGIRF
jgi:hypothetical protein